MNGAARRPRLVQLALALVIAAAGPLVTRPVPVAAATCQVGFQCATLLTNLAGYGSGVVTSDPVGVDCQRDAGTGNGTCSNLFSWSSGDPYLDITLAFAPAASAYACVQPEGLPEFCRGAGVTLYIGVSVYDGETLVVYGSFSPANVLMLHLTIGGTGSGHATSSPTGIDCDAIAGATSGTCSHTWYFTGDLSFGVTYQPSSTSYFCATWLKEGCLGVGKPYTLSSATSSPYLSETVAASFNRATKLTTAVQGQGKVTSSAGGISCPSACTGYLVPGLVVGLVAKPAAGYAFTGWTGACSGETATCNLAVNSTDLSTTARFSKIPTPPPPTQAPATRPTVAPSVPSEPPAASEEPTAAPSSTAEASPSSVPVAQASGSSAPSTAPGAASGGPATPASQGPDGWIPAIAALVVLLLLIVLVGGFLVGRRRRSAAAD